MLANCLRCVYCLPMLMALGCGAGGEPASMDASAIKKYVDDNPAEVTRQERVNRAQEGGAAEDE